MKEKGIEGETKQEKEKRVYGELRKKYPGLTGWEINAAIVQGQGTIDSQSENLPSQRGWLESKIENLKKKKKPKPEVVKRIEEYEERLVEVKGHIAEGTVPAAIFGGKKLWKEVVRKVPGAKEAWRDARSSQYYSQGESANKYGNRHFRLEMTGEKLFLSVRVVEGDVVQWIKMEGQYSRTQLNNFRVMAGKGKKTITLLRIKPGEYEARITVSEPVFGQEKVWDIPEGNFFAGIDLNLDHLAVVITDRQGQFRDHMTFRYGNLGELPGNKSKPIIGNLAANVVDWLKSKNVSAVILEDLKIDQLANDSEVYNRRTVPFSYRQIHAALSRRCLRNGISTKIVNPAYTSWIGDLKYSQMFGVSRHVAAAYVIARRGLNLQELLPDYLVKLIPDIINSIIIPPPSKSAKKDKTRQNALRFHQRLSTWKSVSPKAGKPWLLWATLLSVVKSVPRVRATDRRNYLTSMGHSEDNILPLPCATLGLALPSTRPSKDDALPRPTRGTEDIIPF